MIKGDNRLFGGKLPAFIIIYFNGETDVDTASKWIYLFCKKIIRKKVFMNATDEANLMINHIEDNPIFGSYWDAKPHWSAVGDQIGRGWLWNCPKPDIDNVPKYAEEQIVYRRDMPWDEATEDILQKAHILGSAVSRTRKHQIIEEIDVIHASMKEYFGEPGNYPDVSEVGR